MMHKLGGGSPENMKNIKKVVALITSMTLCMTGCGAKEQANVETEDIATNTSVDSGVDRETIYQVSLLQGLTFGDYNGSVSVVDLKKRQKRKKRTKKLIMQLHQRKILLILFF